MVHQVGKSLSFPNRNVIFSIERPSARSSVQNRERKIKTTRITCPTRRRESAAYLLVSGGSKAMPLSPASGFSNPSGTVINNLGAEKVFPALVEVSACTVTES